MEKSVVFIIINNNNPTSQIITSSESKNGSGVSVIHAQKNVKIKINIQKLCRESHCPLFVDMV